MTREERIEKLRHLITCMKCEVSGKCCDDNCRTQYDAGNMGEIIENLEEIAKALEQEPVLDKIRAEIELKTRIVLKNTPNDDWAVKWNECIKEVLEVIDKYKAESAKDTTNGDIIKAMFKPYKIFIRKYYVNVYLTERDFEGGKCWQAFDVDWWNAPYKVESE